MKKINKSVCAFIFMTFILGLAITQVKAVNVKNTRALFQSSIKTHFLAFILDEKGKKMEGAIARIKGREDQKIGYGQTSTKEGMISIFDYPTNAIMVISKPGYISQEIKTATLKQIKYPATREEMLKYSINVKMVPEKFSKQPVNKKKG